MTVVAHKADGETDAERFATIAGLCALALHPALYPSDATDTGELT